MIESKRHLTGEITHAWPHSNCFTVPQRRSPGRKQYGAKEILWGARHADILSEDALGNVVVDIRRFHDTVPTDPVAGFPYPPQPPRPHEPT